MNIVQKRCFKNTYKKLHQNQRPEVNNAVKEIIKNPEIGEEKKGDLVGIKVYKFNVQNQLHLLAYEVNLEVDEITLLALGTHENFYDNLKK